VKVVSKRGLSSCLRTCSQVAMRALRCYRYSNCCSLVTFNYLSVLIFKTMFNCKRKADEDNYAEQGYVHIEGVE
jgi:hypothetical protein